MKQSTIPAEFQHLNGRISYIQRKSSNEYSASCPECGGVPHQNGELPDRFVMFIDDRPRAWCRKCGLFIWADGEARKLSKEELLLRKEIEEKILEDQKRLIEIKLAQIREDKAWLRWHIDMDEWGKQQWYKRGLPDEFQEFWKLGLNPRYTTEGGFVTSALTIPCFDRKWEITQVYSRLFEIPPGEGGKYRQTKGLRPALFIADPNWLLSEQIIVVEGQIKAQHVFKALINHKIDSQEPMKGWGYNIVAIPSVEPNLDIFEPIKNAKQVTLCLDPDSRVPNKYGRVIQTELIKKMADKYDFEIRTWELFDKVDDIILRYGWGERDVLAQLKQTRRVA